MDLIYKDRRLTLLDCSRKPVPFCLYIDEGTETERVYDSESDEPVPVHPYTAVLVFCKPGGGLCKTNEFLVEGEGRGTLVI